VLKPVNASDGVKTPSDAKNSVYINHHRQSISRKENLNEKNKK